MHIRSNDLANKESESQMARAATTNEPVAVEDGTRVVPIVRIQKVGEITLSPLGSGNPLIEAFSQMGKYLADHDDTDGVALEVTLWDRTFHASIDPAPEPPKSDPANPWD